MPYARRLVLLGCRSGFTLAALEALIECAAPPCGVVLAGVAGATGAAGAERALAVHAPHPVQALCARHDIPVAGVENPHDATSAFQPDLAVLACFPHRLPRAALERPPLGVFNIHPSLLPAWRGPLPLFWQLRAGLAQSGVSLHRVSARLDAGPVLARATRGLVPGERMELVETALAREGARLAVRLLLGDAPPPSGETQDERAASYQGFPQAGDFRLSVRWPAERCFRFAAGTRGMGHAYRIRAGAVEHLLDRVVGFEPGTRQGEAVRAANGALRIRCRPGVLVAVPARRARPGGARDQA